VDEEKKSVPIQVMLTPSQLKVIDDWRFKNRISSRGEAMRQLMAFAVDELTKRERAARKSK